MLTFKFKSRISTSKYAFVLLLLACITLNAQQPKDVDSSIAAYVLMDSVVVQAVKKGLQIEDFIKIMKTDESLYRAFRKLREMEYTGTYQMKFYDKQGLADASLLANGVQECRDNCCEHKLSHEWTFGDFYDRKGNYEYYTASLFYGLFMEEATYCQSEIDSTLPSIDEEEHAHIRYLKKLIFRPGVAIDVPMIGGKTAIFSKNHYPKYFFSLEQKERDSLSYFIFMAELKDEYASDLPIQYLETWFTKEDLQIVERHFHILENSWIYDVDVVMDIELKPYRHSYFPAKIRYNGSWDIPGNRQEKGDFLIQIEPEYEKIRK